MSDVGELLRQAIRLRADAGRLGGTLRVTVTECSPTVIKQAAALGRRVLASSEAEEWDVVQVLGGVVTFFGEHRPIDDSRSTVNMSALDADALARREGE